MDLEMGSCRWSHVHPPKQQGNNGEEAFRSSAQAWTIQAETREPSPVQKVWLGTKKSSSIHIQQSVTPTELECLLKGYTIANEFVERGLRDGWAGKTIK